MAGLGLVPLAGMGNVEQPASRAEPDLNAPYSRALAIFADEEVVGGTPNEVADLSRQNDRLLAEAAGWERTIAHTLTVTERESALTLSRRAPPPGGPPEPDGGTAAAVELARKLQDRFGYAHVPAPLPPAFDHWGGVPAQERMRAVSALLDHAELDRWRARQLLVVTLRWLETQRALATIRADVRRLLPTLMPAEHGRP